MSKTQTCSAIMCLMMTIATVAYAQKKEPRLDYDDARENLDAFLVAFDDLGVDFHRVADVEFCVVFTKLFRFNFLL